MEQPELIKAKDIMIRTPKITYPDVPMLKCIEKMRIENVDSLLVVDETNIYWGSSAPVLFMRRRIRASRCIR